MFLRILFYSTAYPMGFEEKEKMREKGEKMPESIINWHVKCRGEMCKTEKVVLFYYNDLSTSEKTQKTKVRLWAQK